MTTYKQPTDLDLQALRAMGHRIPLCTCGAMEDETRPCPCPSACRLPESVSPAFEGLLSWPMLVWFAVVTAVLGAILWPY